MAWSTVWESVFWQGWEWRSRQTFGSGFGGHGLLAKVSAPRPRDATAPDETSIAKDEP
ncbi:MAG: hypothetical protein HC890_07285 [Chloroflexaceae bacterium]|nr:hypothetical protein [Chloroflexaceae bacterium]